MIGKADNVVGYSSCWGGLVYYYIRI